MIAHFTGESFQITTRHYETLINQAQKNLPKETGGFLGGHGRFIKGILPLFNSFDGDKTGTFGYMPEDAIRARQFFEKNNLEYLGVYHTHPIGSAMPSEQDLKHIQKYMFIISMRDPKNPDFACYEVQGKRYNRVPLDISSGSFSVHDIHSGVGAPTQASEPSFIALDSESGQSHVDGLFDAIISDRPSPYQKTTFESEDDDENGLSFSTVA